MLHTNFDVECKIACTESNFARTNMLKDPCEENKRLLAIKQREMKRVIRRKKGHGNTLD